jgi:hypothetical protein
MAKIVSEKQINNFTKGLITEASPLTFPENASLDEENFDLRLDGSRTRRLGVDYESGYALTATGFTAAQLATGRQSAHRWDFPGGDTSIVFNVVRIQDKLWFFNLLSAIPSADMLNGGVPITIAGLGNSEIETSVVNNFFILVSKDLSYPIVLSYNSTSDSVTQENLLLKVRDVWGIDDGLAIDYRPTTITTKHRYNLRNQGWSTKITSTLGTDAIDATFTIKGVYPSNSDIWTLGKVGSSTSPDFEKYDPNKLILNSIDNSAVSRGSYITDIFNRGGDRTTLSGISGLPNDREQGTITTLTSYASRIFYSGITSNVTGGDNNSPNYSNYIFFSQVAISKDKLSKCYQEADPTSPNISDIIDTDGGTIQIPEASKITKLISAKTSLLAFAENGVWEIFGDTGGFIATSFQMNKITSIGTSNPKSVVNANGTVFYWSSAGIFVLVQEPSSGRYLAQSVSLTTIQRFYLDLPAITKQNARGFYDIRDNCVRWLYNQDTSYSETNYINNFNRELTYNLHRPSFYIYKRESLATNTPMVCDFIPIPDQANYTVVDSIYVGSDPVLITSTDTVVINLNNNIANRTTNYYFLTLRGTDFTFSRYSNQAFLDWQTADGTGVSFTSYLITGYELLGDVLRYKQVPYILFFFDRTEDGFSEVGGNLVLDNQSGCTVQAQWNWANSANSGKWGQSFQAYRILRNYIPSGVADTFDYGDRVIVTKNKLRGSGRALSLNIRSVSGKDMKLLGWATEATGDSKP